mgnify:CR=1 FL=1
MSTALPQLIERSPLTSRGVALCFVAGLAVTAALLAGCASTGRAPAPPREGEVRLDVPFFPNRTYDCGPAVLASVLHFWGVEIPPNAIRSAIVSDNAKGTVTLDMVWFPEEHGLDTRQWTATEQDVKDAVHAGFPVILFVDYGIGRVRQGHYMVVTGVSENAFTVHTGRKQHHRIPLRELRKRWKRTDHWALVATP